MYKIFIIGILTLIFAAPVLAQKDKIKIKEDVVYVNGEAAFKIEMNLRMESFTVYSMQDEKLALFMSQEYFNIQAQSSSNPKGSIKYFEVTFLNEDMDKCEIPMVGMRKALAKEIVANNLIQNGVLNEANVKQFTKIHGNKFSENRGNSTTIIIQH